MEDTKQNEHDDIEGVVVFGYALLFALCFSLWDIWRLKDVVLFLLKHIDIILSQELRLSASALDIYHLFLYVVGRVLLLFLQARALFFLVVEDKRAPRSATICAIFFVMFLCISRYLGSISTGTAFFDIGFCVLGGVCIFGAVGFAWFMQSSSVKSMFVHERHMDAKSIVHFLKSRIAAHRNRKNHNDDVQDDG